MFGLEVPVVCVVVGLDRGQGFIEPMKCCSSLAAFFTRSMRGLDQDTRATVLEHTELDIPSR